MKKNLKSQKGISPILAALLLIIIGMAAVMVTYAWVMTFTGSTRTGAVLTVENVRFYIQETEDRIELVIRNSGTADAKAAEVYQGTSSSDQQQVSSITYDPLSQMISEGSSLKITFNMDWENGTRYYFKVVTEDGISLSFSEEAS